MGQPAGGGDFASAMRAAVQARGLSLERLRVRLTDHGVAVSVATLSYWQTGRSRPERAASLAAIGPLEEVLGVPRGSLATHLSPRFDAAAAARQVDSGCVLDLLPDDRVEAERAFRRFGLDPDPGICRISVHDRVDIGDDGTQQNHDICALLSAKRDGIERIPLWYRSIDPREYPEIIPLHDVRLGPEHRGGGETVAELLLPRPLRSGETTMIGYRLQEPRTGMRCHRFMRGFEGKAREMYVEVRFHPAALPRRAQQVALVDGDEQTREVTAAPVLRHLFLDRPSGIYGLRWQW